MKTLILFTSHHGTTEKLANQLAIDLEINNKYVKNFKKNKQLDLSQFELIIIGSSIHAGSIPTDFQKFLLKNLNILLTKKIAIFMCGMEKGEKLNKEFENNFPKELRDISIANGLLGGEFLFEKMNFLEKLIIKKISGVNNSISEIDYNSYYNFVEKLKFTA